jgi:integrase
LEREGVGAGIREVIYRLLHAAFEQAVAWNLIPRNPMKGVLKPRSPQREMQTLTAEGAARFLEAATGDRYHAAYTILLGCGLRLGEVLGLSWPDVDFNRGTLSIRRQLSKVTQQLKDLKTSGSRRTVQMPAFVADALRAHRDRMQAEGHELTGMFLVFVNEDGRPVRADNFRRRSFHRLLATIGVAATNKKKGILGLRVHDLRHTMATLARKAGVDIQVISRSLGHSKPSITWNVYSHIEPSMPEADAAKIDALFAQKPKEPKAT